MFGYILWCVLLWKSSNASHQKSPVRIWGRRRSLWFKAQFLPLIIVPHSSEKKWSPNCWALCCFENKLSWPTASVYRLFWGEKKRNRNCAPPRKLLQTENKQTVGKATRYITYECAPTIPVCTCSRLVVHQSHFTSEVWTNEKLNICDAKKCCDVNCFFQTRAIQEPSTTAESLLPRRRRLQEAGPVSCIITSYYHCQRKIIAAALILVLELIFVVVDHLYTSFSSKHVRNILQTMPHFTCVQNAHNTSVQQCNWEYLAPPSPLPPIFPTPVSQNEPQS